MAAITNIVTANQATKRIRSATAQANTGQTDWVALARWARTATVYLNMTATSGTTPGPTLVHLKLVDPITLDDTNVVTLTSTVGLTNTGLFVYEIGPAITGGTDVTNSPTRNVKNMVLPPVLGIQVALDRTDGNETYTYTLDLFQRW